MNKELFWETEDKIRRYFAKDNLLGSLNSHLKLLDSKIKVIETDLKNCNVSIEEESSSPSFEQKVQTSGTGMSYAERETMRITEYKSKRLLDMKMEREETLGQIDGIELDYNYIKDAIELVEGLSKQLLEFKYKKNLGEEDIGEKLHLTQSQINKKKWLIVKGIAGYNQWKRFRNM